MIAALNAIVEEVAASLSCEVLRTVMQNICKQADVCLHYKGRHFEYTLEFF